MFHSWVVVVIFGDRNHRHVVEVNSGWQGEGTGDFCQKCAYLQAWQTDLTD